MQNQSDAQLLRQYAAQRSEGAFSEIVARHAGLVYSAALRQVESPELAQDVAQSVFTDLARKAPSLADKLSSDAPLAGWLYRSTRFAARDRLRGDRRRQARERQVMEHFDSTPESSPEWERLRPCLDEAMAELSEEDREAVLLRYFEKQDLHAVGKALGVSEDAAQKRVSRALERLHTGLTSRGVNTTAGALAALLAANTLSFAPAGMAATLSATALAGTTLATAATATATKAIAMTTLQKTLFAAVLTAAVGSGIYEARQASTLQSRVQTLQQQQAPLADQIKNLQGERDDAAREVAALRFENERLNRSSAELLKLRGQIAAMRRERDSAKLDATNKDFAQGSPSPGEEIPVVEPYSAKIRAVVKWDQALITGGWLAPSGKRVVVFAVPKRGAEASQLTIETRIAEFPEETISKLGMADFIKDDGEKKQVVILPPDAYARLVHVANETKGVDLLSCPAVTTISGRQAQIRVSMNQTPSDEKYFDPVMDFMPTISSDGLSVDLSITAQMNYPTGTVRAFKSAP